MIFELTVLGSSSALPTSTKYPAAHVLNVHERLFLIDCGEGAQIQMRKAQLKFGKINHIFISHMHGDHVFGLPGFFSTLDLLGRKVPLHVYGHPDLQLLIDFYLKNFSIEPGYEIVLHPISKRTYQRIYEDKLVEIFAFPLKHRIPTFGFHFIEKERAFNVKKEKIKEYNLSLKQILACKRGEDIELEDGRLIDNRNLTELPLKPRSFAYCSDTSYYEKNTQLLKGVDLIYHEATFLEKDKKLAKQTGHSTAAQAATFSVNSGAGQLLIGHFSNRYKQTKELLEEASAIFSNTLIAEELGKYSIEPSRIVR